MKVYLQTETHQPAGTADVRPKVLLLETAARNAPEVLRAIEPTLGRIIATPTAVHESNLRALLLRDLAEAGVLPGAAEDEGSVVLKVIRTPKDDVAAGQAEVWHLSYQVNGKGGPA